MARIHKGGHRPSGLMALVMAAALALAGCAEPAIPAEAEKAEGLLRRLRESRADRFAPVEFKKFEEDLNSARNALAEERAGLRWFRDYDKVAALYSTAISRAGVAEAKADAWTKAEDAKAAQKESAIGRKISALRQLSRSINEGRLILSSVSQAEVALEEAKKFAARKSYEEADKSFIKAETLAEIAKNSIYPTVSRYVNPAQVAAWQRQAQETIRKSAASNGYAIVIVKTARMLYLYRDGKLARTFEVGLGFNGSRDKVQSGDKATPEGYYSIIKKNPSSNYYRALVLNYPNGEDKRQFELNKQRGLISNGARIGGLIEIHGGGADGMTYGCIALDNPDMEALYNMVANGTPVTIVGTLKQDNTIASLVRNL